MHILGCLDVPTAGQLPSGRRRRRVDFDEDRLAEVRNRYIGFVFQQFNLLPYLTAWRNVELPLVYPASSAASGASARSHALDRSGSPTGPITRPGSCRVDSNSASPSPRALVTEPALILADEPTGNLDSTSTDEILELLGRAARAGRTIVLITHEHDVADARRARRPDPRRSSLSDDAAGRARAADARELARHVPHRGRSRAHASAAVRADDARHPHRDHRGDPHRRARQRRQGRGAATRSTSSARTSSSCRPAAAPTAAACAAGSVRRRR